MKTKDNYERKHKQENVLPCSDGGNSRTFACLRICWSKARCLNRVLRCNLENIKCFHVLSLYVTSSFLFCPFSFESVDTSARKEDRRSNTVGTRLFTFDYAIIEGGEAVTLRSLGIARLGSAFSQPCRRRKTGQCASRQAICTTAAESRPGTGSPPIGSATRAARNGTPQALEASPHPLGNACGASRPAPMPLSPLATASYRSPQPQFGLRNQKLHLDHLARADLELGRRRLFECRQLQRVA